MEERHILDLFWIRAESAIQETADKYGGLCQHIAYNILRSHEDSEECVNDAYMKLWDSIPPQRPENLCAYLSRIVRNEALNRLKRNEAQKRGGGEYTLALEELSEFLPDPGDTEQAVDELLLTDILNHFLTTLPPEARKIFMQRYWFFCSIQQIAQQLSIRESKVKMSLLRSRQKLKQLLIKEGIYYE